MRIEGWEKILAAYLEGPGPFRWGENDCALWAAGWVKACTGRNYLEEWRGRYRDGDGAHRLMEERGFRNPEGVADSCLPSMPVAMARRGDLMLYPNGALGICNGRMSHFLAPDGMLAYETLKCAKAWGVD